MVIQQATPSIRRHQHCIHVIHILQVEAQRANLQAAAAVLVGLLPGEELKTALQQELASMAAEYCDVLSEWLGLVGAPGKAD